MVQWSRIRLPVQETQEVQVQSLGGEDPLEEGTATRSSILAWRLPWTEQPGGLQSMGLQSWTQLKGLSMHAGCTHQGKRVSLAGQQCKGPEAQPGTESGPQGCRV